MRRLPGQRAADPPGPGSRERGLGPPGRRSTSACSSSCSSASHCAGGVPPARTPAAHAGLRLRAADVPARDGGTARCGRRRGGPRSPRPRCSPSPSSVGLLRSHVAHLDAELRARVEELRASRARLVEAGDTERRRLERDLHDGAQARLVGLAMLLGHARRRVDADAEAAALLDRALVELKTSLAELRELARGIHPAVLTERGLGPRSSARRARAGAGDARDRRRASACPARSRSPRTSSSPRRWRTSRSTPRRRRPPWRSGARTGA